MGADSTPAPDGATALTIADEWKRLMATHTEAFAVDAAINAVYDRALEEKRDLSKLEADWNAAGEALHDARDNLLLADAPDYPAVQWKLAQLFSEGDYKDDQHISAWNRKFTDAIMSDMARLAGQFATAWLAFFAKGGGSVHLLPDGKAQFGYPAYDLSPEYAALGRDEVSAKHRDSRYNFLDGRYHGAMNAALDGLATIPGGAEMIKANMRARGVVSHYAAPAEGQEAGA